MSASQDEHYRSAIAALGPALERLSRGYEADADLRRDLVQDIHTALWRSFASYEARCSLRTWTYRVAHNVGASHVLRRRGKATRQVGLEELADAVDQDDPERNVGERRAMARLMGLIQALTPPDSQVMLLYLEDLDAAAIGEVVGLSAGAVATKIHRIKNLLARQFQSEER